MCKGRFHFIMLHNNKQYMKNFVQSQKQAFRTVLIFVQLLLQERLCAAYVCITAAHSSVDANFCTVLILVQNERCTESYENNYVCESFLLYSSPHHHQFQRHAWCLGIHCTVVAECGYSGMGNV